MERSATRTTARIILGQFTPQAFKSLALVAACLIIAGIVSFVPTYQGLSPQGVLALYILTLCAGLWITEAMPAFAVSLLAMGLAIALLGNNGDGQADWEKYIATWGSPLVWLFFGGFILAEAAKKTGLDRWMALHVLSRLGSRPAVILFGVMASTAVLSMFLSNTATATMMVAMLGPLLANYNRQPRRARALLLGIAMAANIGGMGTIIGTPPNAIAAGVLADVDEIDFAEWMLFGIPPAVLLLSVAWIYLTLMYLGQGRFSADENMDFSSDEQLSIVPPMQQSLVVITFFTTVLLWLASPWHGIPTTVISFIPICVLTATGTLDSDDLKNIAWDVLLLIAGGLSLGIAVKDTGLADWLVSQLPMQDMGPVAIALCLAFVATALSNLMSNTAAANVILPLAFAMLGSTETKLIVPIALSASAAMCLPISTPPNAIVYGTRRLKSTDLLAAGLLIGLIAPLITTGWATYVMRY